MKKMVLGLALSFLAACGGSGSSNTGTMSGLGAPIESDLVFGFQTALVEPDINGQFADAGPENALIIQDSQGGGIAYGFFSDIADSTFDDDPALAGSVGILAGIIPGTDVGWTPRSGRGTFTGEYGVTQVGGFTEFSSGEVVWDQTEFAGPITIDVNFNTGRMAGTSDDGRLSVEADDVNGGNPSSFISFNNVATSSSVFVGRDAVVATFFGFSDRIDFAGGLVAERVRNN